MANSAPDIGIIIDTILIPLKVQCYINTLQQRLLIIDVKGWDCMHYQRSGVVCAFECISLHYYINVFRHTQAPPFTCKKLKDWLRVMRALRSCISILRIGDKLRQHFPYACPNSIWLVQ